MKASMPLTRPLTSPSRSLWSHFIWSEKSVRDSAAWKGVTDLGVFSPQADVEHLGALRSKVLGDVHGEVLHVGKTRDPAKHESTSLSEARLNRERREERLDALWKEHERHQTSWAVTVGKKRGVASTFGSKASLVSPRRVTVAPPDSILYVSVPASGEYVCHVKPICANEKLRWLFSTLFMTQLKCREGASTEETAAKQKRRSAPATQRDLVRTKTERFWFLHEGSEPFTLLLGRVLELSRRVSVESEGLFGFSAGVVEGHLRDVLVPGGNQTTSEGCDKQSQNWTSTQRSRRRTRTTSFLFNVTCDWPSASAATWPHLKRPPPVALRSKLRNKSV